MSNRQGTFSIDSLDAGRYLVTTAAHGFSTFVQPDVVVTAGQTTRLDMRLDIAVKEEKLVVKPETRDLDVNPAQNAGMLVIAGKDLDALSDDPDELASQLQALAGPSAGPNGGEIYIDGFTGGELPPKSAIREIRINQNPFSAEYDRMGFGRIEILTKPGSDQFHGSFMLNGNSSAFNSRNPFLLDAQQPGYHSDTYNATLGGKLNGRASFFFSADRRVMNDSSIINAQILDSNLNPTTFTQALANPKVRTGISPRLDYQLSSNQTLTLRYQFTQTTETNDGVGQFSLASQAYDVRRTEQVLQVSDSLVLSARAINEIRFQYMRGRDAQSAQDLSPTIDVMGAFTGGGSAQANADTHTDQYELQDNASLSLGRHLLKFGGRLRANREASYSAANFNGTFTFSSLAAYQITEAGLQQGWSAAQIQAAGGGAAQFSIVYGQPRFRSTLFDAGVYTQDDWRLRPRLTLSYGLRLESQNHLNDHADWAPRLAISWGLGRGQNPPKTVLRAGYGIFYDRIGQNLIMQTEELNGVSQQQIMVASPAFFPVIPSLASLAGSLTTPVKYQTNPDLRTPYAMQSALSMERKLSSSAAVALTCLNTRGLHQLRSSVLEESSGNVYEYLSTGIFKQNQLIGNFRVRAASRISLFGFYALGSAKGNTSGANSFPSNDPSADYGRTAYDVRHRFLLAGSFELPYALRLSPFVMVSSGQPFNITTGTDLNGDGIFNDRPAFATSTTSPENLRVTPWGNFDVDPSAGEKIIPINFGSGPGQFTLNLRASRTIQFGKKYQDTATANGPEGPGGPGGPGAGGPPPGGPGGGPGGGGPGGGGPGGGGPPPGGPGGGPEGQRSTNQVKYRYGITFSVSARNLLNHISPGTPVGDLSSALFGKSNTLAGDGPFASGSANRRIDMDLRFSF
jgi:hypothetical protein